MKKKLMREKRDKISKEIADMDYKQMKEYFSKKKIKRESLFQSDNIVEG